MLAIPSLATITTQSVSLVLLVFTYILPLLSTIRAVHNRDKPSYHQWVTYFLLLFGLVNPLTSLFTFHPLFQITIILWLSLPRFQGAHYVYTQVIQVFVLEKYNVEERVDGEIRRVTQSIQSAVWNILQDVSWCALAQVGDVVGLIKASMPVLEEPTDDNREDRGQLRYQQPSHDDDARDDARRDHEHDTDDSHTAEEDADTAEEDGEEQGSEIETDHTRKVIDPPHRLHQDHDTSPSSHRQESNHDSIIKPISSYTSLSSIRSSFRSYEDEENHIDDKSDDEMVTKSYLRDLTEMLQSGLYVYASHVDGSDIASGGGNDIGGDIDNTSSDNGTRPFRLSLFSYHPTLSTTIDGNNKTTQRSNHECFVFGPKPSPTQSHESQSRQMAKDSVILPVGDVIRVRKLGTHAIEFITASTSLTPESQRLQLRLRPTLSASFLSGSISRGQSACSDVSEEDFVTLMKSWSNTEGAGGDADQQQVVKEEEEDGCVFAEMVLSNGEDRDTLFAGLKTLVKIFGTHSEFNDGTEEEEEEEEEDIRSDDASGEWTSEVEAEEEAEEKVAEEKNGEVGEEESSPDKLHGDELEKVLTDKEILNSDEEDEYDARKVALDYDSSNIESLVVDELVVEEDAVSHHSAKNSDKEEHHEGSSPNVTVWAHGTMADDQALT